MATATVVRETEAQRQARHQRARVRQQVTDAARAAHDAWRAYMRCIRSIAGLERAHPEFAEIAYRQTLYMLALMALLPACFVVDFVAMSTPVEYWVQRAIPDAHLLSQVLRGVIPAAWLTFDVVVGHSIASHGDDLEPMPLGRRVGLIVAACVLVVGGPTLILGQEISVAGSWDAIASGDWVILGGQMAMAGLAHGVVLILGGRLTESLAWAAHLVSMRRLRSDAAGLATTYRREQSRAIARFHHLENLLPQGEAMPTFDRTVVQVINDELAMPDWDQAADAAVESVDEPNPAPTQHGTEPAATAAASGGDEPPAPPPPPATEAEQRTDRDDLLAHLAARVTAQQREAESQVRP